LHYRPLGNSDIHVSEVGLGCNRLGAAQEPDAHWIGLVQRAVDLGVNVFDTAEAYGWGRSEAILGQALGNRTDVCIASKMGRLRETGEKDYSAAHMMKTVEASLRRLQRDCIDIYQLHSPNRAQLEQFDWAEGMERLREQGKIRLRAVAIGNPDDGVWLIEQRLVDVLQITYNIFVTAPEEKLFDLATQHGVGLLCRMPLARGVLTGKFQPGQPVDEAHRATLDGDLLAERVRKAEMLRPLAESYPGGMTRLAHHFSLTPSAISAIIPGARTVEQLEENVAASNGAGLPADVRQQIDRVRRQWGN